MRSSTSYDDNLSTRASHPHLYNAQQLSHLGNHNKETQHYKSSGRIPVHETDLDQALLYSNTVSQLSITSASILSFDFAVNLYTAIFLNDWCPKYWWDAFDSIGV